MKSWTTTYICSCFDELLHTWDFAMHCSQHKRSLLPFTINKSKSQEVKRAIPQDQTKREFTFKEDYNDITCFWRFTISGSTDRSRSIDKICNRWKNPFSISIHQNRKNLTPKRNGKKFRPQNQQPKRVVINQYRKTPKSTLKKKSKKRDLDLAIGSRNMKRILAIISSLIKQRWVSLKHSIYSVQVTEMHSREEPMTLTRCTTQSLAHDIQLK